MVLPVSAKQWGAADMGVGFIWGFNTVCSLVVGWVFSEKEGGLPTVVVC